MFRDPFFIKHWSQVLSNHPSKQFEQSLGPVQRVLGNYCGPVDQFVATPFANAKALEEASGSNIVEAINHSRYAKVWYGSLVGVGLLALLIGHVVSVYRALRNDEKKSHFFYFRRLLQSDTNNKIKNIMGEDGIDYEILNAAAYFYSPGIPRLVCWKRRFFCWGKRRKEYADLKDYLTKEGLARKKTEKEILDSIFIETIDKLVKFLNKKTSASDLSEKFQRKEGSYLIGFSEEYSKVFFPEKIALPEKSKENVSLGQSILGAIEEASFFYWICMFAFYFAPTVGLIAGVPLALALSFLTIRCVYVTYASKKDFVNKQIRLLNNKEADDLEVVILKRKYESDDVELKKQEIFVNDKVAHIAGITSFQDSKLRKDLWKVLGHRRFMKAVAIVNGFISGCFAPFFGIWLFTDLFKVLAWLAIGGVVVAPATVPITAPIVFMVIASVTLVLGVSYGIKKAIEAAKEQDEKYEKLENEVQKLERFPEHKTEVLNVGSHDYDRVLRRFSLEQPRWTQGKKFLNRSWVVISRLGTGSLVFRLVIWGSVTAFMSTSAIAAAAPITIPFIIGSAVIFAVWHVCAYNVEKQYKKAVNIINHFYSARMVAVKEMIYKKASPDKKEERRTEPFASPKLLSISKSEICLTDQNIDSADLKKRHANDSGGASPDAATITKISFNNPQKEEGRKASGSKSPSLNCPLKKAELGSSLQHLNFQESENNVKSSSDLNSNAMARHRR
ncbi:hypothetical protein [Rickettsiella endosymbiont of Dermanyssus gallinae]|uniref:hypothetical protein n=1 Tax=Rickettsiella endosymbiont of Dermanyssus gallinae TaxID=2856608 RepID=UPI001C527C80|nr:hypothetical protein [Rickettsiella endosymbiont of Dermanyssus gallinae]